VDRISSKLAGWMPRLIGVYRSVRRSRGPEGRLLPAELAAVTRGVRRLSEGLTRRRHLVGTPYMEDPDLLGAYLLYFWPVSYAQGLHAIGEIGARPRAVLDLGSGPGPLAMAALDAGASDVMAADRSASALELCARVASSAGRAVATRTWDPLGSDELPGGTQAWSVISVGHALNELWAGEPDRIEKRAAFCRRLLDRLRKGGSLVLIEPALQVTTRELLEVRDRLVAQDVPVRAPCLFRGACPALERPADWCHAERAWEPPTVLEEIIQEAGLHKEALKMAYVILGRPGEAWPEAPGGRLFRIVSEQLPGKSRVRVMGCGGEGRIPLALGDSARTPENQAFLEAQRGDVIDVAGAEPAQEGPGLRITETTRVRIARRADEPISPRQSSSPLR
jgi:SAM-dependent methyltransferase